MDDREFWFTHFAQRIDPTLKTFCANFNVPTKTRSGVQPFRLGAKDIFYICTPKKALVIGGLAIASRDDLEIHETDGRRRVAEYLLQTDIYDFEPVMFGTITRANPTPAFAISRSPWHMFYCLVNEGFMFNLERLQKGHEILQNYPWKTVSSTLHCIEEARSGNKAKQARLALMLEKQPALVEAVAKSGITGRSPEHTLLSWANITWYADRQDKSTATSEDAE